MRNALVIVIVCLSVSLLYDVYKEPIDRLLHLDQTETNETTETGNRKQKTKKQAQKPDGQQEEGLPSAYDGRMTGKAPEVKNQGTFGTCWAVVTSSALESRLLPQEDIVFSADHISTQNSYAIGQEEGGAYNIAIAYLTDGVAGTGDRRDGSLWRWCYTGRPFSGKTCAGSSDRRR